MNWCVIVLALLLSAQKSWSYPSARFEEANSFEKYLEKARTVLDRVPLIDGYKERNSFQIVRKLLITCSLMVFIGTTIFPTALEGTKITRSVTWTLMTWQHPSHGPVPPRRIQTSTDYGKEKSELRYNLMSLYTQAELCWRYRCSLSPDSFGRPTSPVPPNTRTPFSRLGNK